MAETLWRLRARSLKKARKAFHGGEPDGLHNMRVALRRIEATAAALGKNKIQRRSGRLVASLSELRQLEIDRHLLSRVRALRLLTEDAASSLDARWSALHSARAKKAARLAEGKKMDRLIRRLRALTRPVRQNLPVRLELARRRAERKLAPPAADSSDRVIHRYRVALKRARYIAEDLAACGVAGLEATIAREKELQDALGRWNDLRLFRERLLVTRAQAEERGAVTLAIELDRLIATLEATVAATRSEALSFAARLSNVLPFLERSA